MAAGPVEFCWWCYAQREAGPGAVRALGERAEPRALDPLLTMAHDPDPYLAAAAVHALAHFGFADVRPTLREVARLGPAPARRASSRVLTDRERGDKSS